MAGVNKTSLQHRCFTAGLSTEGTKKDLLARLRIYNAVGVLEAIIYKEAVQVPENGESSKAKYCGQEIARELKSAIPGQRATGSARWGNLAGLLKLEMDRVFELEAEMPKLKSAYAKRLAIRNRFFSSFLRDHHPAQYTPGVHKNGRKPSSTPRLLSPHRCRSFRYKYFCHAIWLTTGLNLIAT